VTRHIFYSLCFENSGNLPCSLFYGVVGFVKGIESRLGGFKDEAVVDDGSTLCFGMEAPNQKAHLDEVVEWNEVQDEARK